MTSPSRRVAAILALVTGAALWSLAAAEPGAMVAAETRHLAVLATAILLGLSVWEPRAVVVAGPTVLALAWWAPGTARPASLLAVLVFATLAGASRSTGVAEANGARASVDPESPARGAGFDLVALAGILQVVTRTDLLLVPDVRHLVQLLAPLLLLVLVARDLESTPRRLSVVVALVAATLLEPGLDGSEAGTIAGLALCRRRDKLRWLAPLLPLFGFDLVGIAGVGVVLVSMALRARSDARLDQGLRLLGGVGGLAAIVLVAEVVTGHQEVGTLPFLLPLLAPLIVRFDRLLGLAAGFLSLGVVIGGRADPTVEGWLLPGVLLLALGSRSSEAPEYEETEASCLLAGVFAFIALAAASYPWLRSDPLTALGETLGISMADFTTAEAGAALGALALTLLVVGLDRRVSSAWRAPLAAALILALLVAGSPHVLGAPLDEQPVVLHPDKPGFAVTIPEGTRRLVLDSQLAHAVDLPLGSPVAALRFLDEDGTLVHREVLRVGDTGDWAAGRPDQVSLVAEGRLAAPPVWSHRIAEDGRFTARRYRATFELPPDLDAVKVHIRRRGNLPTPTRIILHRIEARR